MRSMVLLGASTLALSLPLSAVAAPEFYGRINISLDRLSDYQDGNLPGALASVGRDDSPLEDGWHRGESGREAFGQGGTMRHGK